MSCNHTYDEHGLCFECDRPQNAIDKAQEWLNTYDAAYHFHGAGRFSKLESEALDIVEWLLEDLEK